MIDKQRVIQICKGLEVVCPEEAEDFVAWVLDELDNTYDTTLDIQFYNILYYRACREGLMYIAQQLWSDDSLKRYKAFDPKITIYEDFLRSRSAEDFVTALIERSTEWKLPEYEKIEFPDNDECIRTFKDYAKFSRDGHGYSRWLFKWLRTVYVPWYGLEGDSYSSELNALEVYAEMHYEAMLEDRANGIF